jgi:uncharacterized protein
MAASILVDTTFLIALLARRDSHHLWAATQAAKLPPPWHTCEAVLSETFHLVGPRNAPQLSGLIRHGALTVPFSFARNHETVLKLLQKYADVPMSFADACLVRMTETIGDAALLTADADFRIYRRHGRYAIPAVMPN